MYEIRTDRKAELRLTNVQKDVLEYVRFRLRCKTEGKIGWIAAGFGVQYWVDATGEYMDGVVPPGEIELASIMEQLKS